MTASKTCSNHALPKGVDPNDPLIWFNPGALGIEDKPCTKKTSAKQASGYQSGSPQTSLHRTVSGRSNYRYSKSGFIKSESGLGSGKLLLTSDERVTALGHRAKFDARKKMWAPDMLRHSTYFQSGKANGSKLFRPKRKPSQSSRLATVPQDKGVKTPSVVLRNSGTTGVAGSLSRNHQLVPTQSGESGVNPFKLAAQYTKGR